MARTNNYSIKLFWMYMRPNIRYVYWGIILSILVGLTQLAIPVLLRYILDTFTQKNSFINTDILSILICATFFLNTSFKLIKDYFFECFAQYTIKNIKTTIVKKLVSSPMSFYDKNISGDLFSRINTDAESLENVYSEEMASSIYQPLIILACSIDLFYINWKLACLIILIIPPVILLSIKLAIIIKDKSKSMLECNSKTNIVLQEILLMSQTIKIFCSENKTIDKYSKLLTDTTRASILMSIYRLLIGAIGSFILLFGVFVVLRYATSLIVNGSITLGELGEFLVCVIFVGNAFSSLASSIGTIQKSSGAVERLFEIINSEEENVNSGNKDLVFSKSLQFQDVVFSYPTRPSLTILDNVNFNISKNEKIGIIGESGSGKSSIINLLLGLYKINSGNILIDGHSIYDYNIHSYRNLFSVVSQNIKLFSGSIKENILYGIEDENPININKICSLAGCDFIENLPNGVDTYIGEDGITLSGGQRQRISLARALVRDSQILILDEATSALDINNESVIVEEVLQYTKEKTLIVLTHRMPILKYMDKIYKIDNKKIIELNHNEIDVLNN
ncbi:ABC transporter ATP-binding protein [Phocaeicola vulgatus]|jgi:ABC-type bacteriocin/lantibiotic exporter with double-glycine peptidase domain|uniref:ABC transporter ATP-binding protein n=1 Tax=Phocaeicola vulgatus TaxID=821 RepID=UPI0021661B20|nr:ABC transporter ATP-binding protein [Phocaeicola vulgatus]MCS2749122.1 ABC transporter ATP-binding protein/permease [Phocaeicola vulgatus]